MNILNAIIANKKKEIATRKKARPLSSFIKTVLPSDRDFEKALKNGRNDGFPRLIAELKKASPSEGLLRPNLEKEVETIARIYDKHAAAISVVTDEKFFQGKGEWIARVKKTTGLPILCKDFIIDEYQIYEARKYGADAVLLIVCAFDWSKKSKHKNYDFLKKCIKCTQSLGIAMLVEIHDQKELDIALDIGAKIIGINNRNLETFSVSLKITLSLAPLIPRGITIISESGFKTREDIKKIRGRVDAALVGTRLMRTKNINSEIFRLFHF
jgi:indole-3-glycerol phosphate synthase